MPERVRDIGCLARPDTRVRRPHENPRQSFPAFHARRCLSRSGARPTRSQGLRCPSGSARRTAFGAIVDKLLAG